MGAKPRVCKRCKGHGRVLQVRETVDFCGCAAGDLAFKEHMASITVTAIDPTGAT